MTGPVPPYMRLAELIRGDIAAGRLKPGDRLPSISQLGDDHGLSPGTVQKALRILKDEGLIVGSPGYGVFVAER